MKHRYSPRLYEILKSYQFNNKRWTFENGTGSQYDLQRMLGDAVLEEGPDKGKPIIPNSWSNWAIFKRDVLEPAVKEINKYTDIKVAYDGKKEDIHHRKTRAIRTIVFYMVGKTGLEQRNTDDVIDAEYQEIEERNNNKYHQYSLDEMSVEDAFFKAHDKSLEIERMEKELIEAQKKEEQAGRSKYPILFGTLNDDRDANFDEKKIQQLFSAAIRGRVAGKVDFRFWELFATDMVTHYYDKIAATPEETRSTPYRRLLNCLENDYDEKADEFVELHRKR
jgi:plasmid replication initiation protein